MAKYKNTKQIAKSAKKEISDSKLHKYLIAIPVIALVIKFITMTNIQEGIWAGADGENYMAGVEGLFAEGFFSDEPNLSYWPAGYPILLWPIAVVSTAKFFYILSFFQSIFFAFSTYFFTNNLSKSSLRFLSLWVSIIITFNPTLSLSSLTIGYESPTAACFMMIAGLILSTFDKPIDKRFWIAAASVGGWLSLATFMQPRFMLIAIVIAILWALKLLGTKNRIKVIALVTTIMLVAPGIMIFRNTAVIDRATISTNLGVTMSIGAGPETTGSFDRTGPEVPCEPNTTTSTVSDNELVLCVIRWYASNPVGTVRLSLNKSVFFWSPWTGPIANGTMARNPWLLISPVQKMTASGSSGKKYVTGVFGSTVSYIWLFGQVAFVFIGYRSLRRLGSNEKFFANIALSPIVLSWLIAIGTIGDHRFRIPTMSMSLFLQMVAILAIGKYRKSQVD